MIRWSRVLAIAVSLAVVSAASLAISMQLSKAPAPTEPEYLQIDAAFAATDAQQAELVAAVVAKRLGDPVSLAKGHGTHWGTRALVASMTLPICRPPAPTEAKAAPACADPIAKPIPWSPSALPIPPVLREGLLNAGGESVPLPDPGVRWVVLESSELLHALLAQADGWQQLRALHPDASSVFEVSRAAVSRDGRHAAIYVEYHCGPMCGHSTLERYERGSDGWNYVDADPGWVR